MSGSALSFTIFPGSILGFLQIATVLSLLLLLFKTAQFYLRRRWLLRATQQFPSPPSHWFFGHKVGRKEKGGGRPGRMRLSENNHQTYKSEFVINNVSLWNSRLRMGHISGWTYSSNRGTLLRLWSSYCQLCYSLRQI